MGKIAWYVFLLLLVALVYGLGAYTGPDLLRRFSPSSSDATGVPLARESRSALGRLQPSGGIISIVAPPGDRIDRLFVRQGEKVAKGDKLVELASLKDREEELKLARDQLGDARKQLAAIRLARTARLKQFEAQLKSLRDGAAIERKLQDSKVKGLEEQVRIARNQVEALKQLSVAKVPREQMDRAEGALAQYRLELDAARTSLRAIEDKLKSQLEDLEAQKQAVLAEFDLKAESVSLASLEQKVKLAELHQERSRITAPVAGTVLKIFHREGDSTGPEPILQIAAGEGMIALAEVYATDVPVLLGWMRRGDILQAEVSSPALGDDRLTGRLTDPHDISRSVARNSVTGFSPRADSDRRIVEVRVALDEKSSARAAEFVGLEVTVEFKPAPKK